MSLQDFIGAEAGMSRSVGLCNTMGTASTMASLVESMGLSLPMNAALPAVDARRMTLAHLTGIRIVEMVREDLRLSKVLTRASFENAIIANAALGGSTNAVVHLLAIAGRIGVSLELKDFDLGSEIPLLVNCLPSGKHMMEEFCYAGGAIRGLENPVKPAAGIRVLRGNLAPDGAVIKPSAATEELLKHEGPALVFASVEDMHARMNGPELDVTPDTVLVLQGCGPKGYPGTAEVGNMPIPARLVQQGVRDMVRISDARMSGAAFGTVVLHVAAEAAAGGALAPVRTGDRIPLDARASQLDLLVDAAELDRRRAACP